MHSIFGLHLISRARLLLDSDRTLKSIAFIAVTLSRFCLC